jgi:hypothetical protein
LKICMHKLALQTWNFWIFSFLGGQFEPVWIAIRRLIWIRIQSGSTFGSCLQTRLNSNPIGNPEDCVPYVLLCMKWSLLAGCFSFIVWDRIQWFDLQYFRTVVVITLRHYVGHLFSNFNSR